MLKKIHFAFSTAHVRHAGTHSKPILILGDYNKDRLQHTFDPDQGIEAGSSHIYDLDVTSLQFRNYFPIIRMGLRGADAWLPQVVFVFGENEAGESPRYTPLAFRNWMPEELSTDESEGLFSVPLFRASLGTQHTACRRLVVLIQNEDLQHAGTQSPVHLSIAFKDGSSWEYEFDSGELEGRGAAFLAARYTRQSFHVTDVREVKLSIDGEDQWAPRRIFIYGVDERANEYETMVPLVTVGEWEETGLPLLSSDEKEGAREVLLYRSFF